MKWVELEIDSHGKKLRANSEVVAATISIVFHFKL